MPKQRRRSPSFKGVTVAEVRFLLDTNPTINARQPVLSSPPPATPGSPRGQLTKATAHPSTNQPKKCTGPNMKPSASVKKTPKFPEDDSDLDADVNARQPAISSLPPPPSRPSRALRAAKANRSNSNHSKNQPDLNIKQPASMTQTHKFPEDDSDLDNEESLGDVNYPRRESHHSDAAGLGSGFIDQILDSGEEATESVNKQDEKKNVKSSFRPQKRKRGGQVVGKKNKHNQTSDKGKQGDDDSEEDRVVATRDKKKRQGRSRSVAVAVVVDPTRSDDPAKEHDIIHEWKDNGPEGSPCREKHARRAKTKAKGRVTEQYEATKGWEDGHGNGGGVKGD